MDEVFMQEALAQAKMAAVIGEVPVGAVLVMQGKIIARAHNLVEKLQDATAHAEILCIKRASEILGNWRLLGATLYCTLEPCAMCAGGMISSRVETLVWGAPDIRQGAHGSWVDLLTQPHPIHQLTVRTHVLVEESKELLTAFFRERRHAKTL